MARKLTKEELERNKADFDIPAGLKPLAEPKKGTSTTTKKAPAKNTKTGAKKKTSEQKKREEESAVAISMPEPETPKPEKHAGGRPRKSDEETRVFSFRLTERTVRRLRVLAALQGVSAADIIADLADREKVPGIDK